MAAKTKVAPANGNGKAPSPEVLEWLEKAVGGTTEGPVDNFREAAPLLRRPFTPQAVKFKVQAKWPKDNPTTALVVAYIDARLVIERLNMVVAENWSPRYEREGKEMWCHLTLFDLQPRSDIGEGVGKGLVSDSLKRAAVHWGVGVSLYATDKIGFEKASGLVRAARSKEGPTLKLTDAGEVRCRDLYEEWLTTTGIPKFGQPLDHGDSESAAGDIEVDDDGAPGGGGEQTSAEKPAATESAPATEQKQEPPVADDDESRLATFLAKKSELKKKREQANEGMEALGAGPGQRLRELEAATSSKQLDALIGRINNAMDGGAG